MAFFVNLLFVNGCYGFVQGSAHLPVQVLTVLCRTLYTPPIFCVKPIQAETIIAAVGICLLGLVQI